MKNFDRIFGSGPKGLSISLVLLFLAIYLKKPLGLPDLFGNGQNLGIVVFAALAIVTVAMIVWSVRSLNVKSRGKNLVTAGALKYFRHPLYAVFLTFFDFGLAFLLNNWIFLIWAIVLHPIWHLLVAEEEKTLKGIFPNEYEEYCKRTGRFFPKLFTGRMRFRNRAQ